LVCASFYSKNPTLYNTNGDEEGNYCPDTPPREPSPTPTSLEYFVEEGQNCPQGESATLTSGGTTVSTLAEKDPHALDAASISGPAPHVIGGAQVAAGEHKDTDSFDIFDSDDHASLRNGRRDSIDSTDGSIFIGNGLASPKHFSTSPPPDGHLITPAPKKTASLLTPPPSGEKTSATSVCPQETATGVSPSEKKAFFTLPNEENLNGDPRTPEQEDLSKHSDAQNNSGDVTLFRENGHPTLPHEEGHGNGDNTLEQDNISALSHEENHTGDIAPFEENGYSTYENCDGDVHTLELGDLSAPPHEEYHSGHVTQFEENDSSTLSQSNYGDIQTLEGNDLPALPHELDHDGNIQVSEQNYLSTPLDEENHTGDIAPFEENGYSTCENCAGHVHTLEQGDPSTPSHEENHSGPVTQFQENDYSTLPLENCDGDVHTLELGDPTTTVHEEYHSGHVTQPEENDHSTLPHENYDGDVRTWEQGDQSTLSPEGNHNGDVARFEENGYSTFPHETCESDVRTLEPKDLSTLPHEENHYGDAHTPDKAPCEPHEALKITNIHEPNSGRQVRGDYWRPSMTDSRTNSRYGDSYRHKETGGSSHQFRSSGRHLSDSNSGGRGRGRRDRSRSPARDIKRGRFRDFSPSHRRLRSRDGLHGLSRSNASRQTEDKDGWHRFGSQTFKGDRYIPSPEPTRPTRRSPAPSPGRELTPPRHTPRNLSRGRLPAPTLPERRFSRQPEYTPSKAHPTRSSGPLPDQSIAFQNSIRSMNTNRHHSAVSAFEGGHSADMRNSNYVQPRIPTSPKRPEKRRRHEDEPPVQNKRSRRDEQAYNGGRGHHWAPRQYGSR